MGKGNVEKLNERLSERKRLEALKYLGKRGEREAEFIRNKAEGKKLLKIKKTILLHTPDYQLPDPDKFEAISARKAAVDTEEGVVYITDDVDVYASLASLGKPVIVYENDYNMGIDFTGAPYIIQEIEDIPEYYFNRRYRRLERIPWDILRTDRLLVRETVPTDVPEFYDIYSDPEITEYMEDLDQDPAAEIRKTEEYAENAYDFYEYGIWTVLIEETHEIIGRAGIEQLDDSEIPSLGFMIGKKYQHNGYATEVCQKIIDYADKMINTDFIRVCVNEKNTGSIELCKKLGFKEPKEYMQELGNDYRSLRNMDGLVNLVRKMEN